MRKTLNKSAAFLLGAFFAVLIAGAQFSNVAAADDGFAPVDIAPGSATSTNFIEVLLPFLSNHPETSEGLGKMELDVTKEDEVFQVCILKSGYLDDSVSGEEHRGTVIWTKDGEWELIKMAVKPICWRGEPTNGRCP